MSVLHFHSFRLLVGISVSRNCNVLLNFVTLYCESSLFLGRGGPEEPDHPQMKLSQCTFSCPGFFV
jgi:hypothetical protein